MRTSLIALCAILFAAVASFGGVSAVDPSITIPGVGTVVGVFEQSANANAYRGIPYAEAPVGARRFVAPVPAKPLSSTLVAKKFGPGCPSPYPGANTPVDTAEDCLTLNVFTPSYPSATPLPVLIWFYGGSFSSGSGGGPLGMYDGSYMAGHENVIVVSFNYRLSAFGFLVTDKVAGNAAILDQKLVMEWVRDHISSFGGDKNQVTLFGQSAGAYSIGVHLTWPKSWGLYKRAVMHSSPVGVRMQERTAAAIYGREFCRLQGCLRSESGGAKYSCDLACMQATSVSKVKQDLLAVLANSTAMVEADGTHLLRSLLGFKPVVDGDMIKDNLIELLDKKAVNPNAQVLIGTTADEAAVFAYDMETIPKLSMAEYAVALTAVFGSNKGLRLYYYYKNLFTDGFAALSRTITDMWFRCSMNYWADVTSAKSGTKSYVYRYTHVFSSPAVFDFFDFPKECHTQVCHSADLPFIFHFTESTSTVRMSMTAAEKALSAQLTRYIVNFARSGNPNNDVDVAVTPAGGLRARLGLSSDASPAWPSYAAPSRTNLLVGDSYTTENAKALCELWDTVGYVVPNFGASEEAAAAMGGWEAMEGATAHDARSAALLAQMPRARAAVRSGDALGALVAAAVEARELGLVLE